MLVGGAGFIGHNLALGLPAWGLVMVVDNQVVNNLSGLVANSDIEAVRHRVYMKFLLSRYEMMRGLGVELRNVDARLMSDLTSAVNDFQPNQIVHLSAISSAVEARKNPGLCFDLQLITLRNVLELSRERRTPVMFLSSSTVYGDFEKRRLTRPTGPSRGYLRERQIHGRAARSNLCSTTRRTVCHHSAKRALW